MKCNRIVLASASPRRREILKLTGLDFEVIPAVGEEHTDSVVPCDIVMNLSRDKAMEVASACDDSTLVIGADTVVAAEGRIMGKPKDRDMAYQMLSSLRNDCHSVYTGVTIVYNETVRSFVSETKVYICDMTDEEIYSYIDTGECYDKAGAYGIQGRFSMYVDRIEGDYFNVVGLPVSKLMQEIKKLEVIYE